VSKKLFHLIMPVGTIKLIKNDFDCSIIELEKEYNIERKIYLLENYCDFEIKFTNFSGTLNIIFVENNKKYKFYYHHVEKDKFFFGGKGMCMIYFDGEGKFMLNYCKRSCEYFLIDKYFLDLGFTGFYLSQDLLHLREKVRFSYGLDYGENLIFGMYNNVDLEVLKNNINCGILWGGSDIMLESSVRSKSIEIIKSNGNINFAMSQKIYDKLVVLGVSNIKKVCISFCWNDIKYRFVEEKFIRKRGIYIYDGLDRSEKKKKIYNQKVVDKVIEKLKGEYEIYRSSNGYREDVFDLYRKSFVSLRLTEYDGNANSAQECGMLGIPVISNQEMNHSISWGDSDEIVHKINYIFKKNIKIRWRKEGINLLLISNDKPGNGGGASMTYELGKYLSGRGYNVYEMYLNNDVKFGMEKIGERKYIVRLNQNNKDWGISGLIEKIRSDFKVILRSAISTLDLKKLIEKYEVLFFIPGIFKNELSCYWKDLDENDLLKVLNIGNIKNAGLVNSYCNSMLTQSLYLKYGFHEMDILEINFLKINKIVWGKERDIDFIFVVSNIERKIKNCELFFELASKLNYKFLLVSTEKVDKKLKNIECISGVDIEEMSKYYLRSKCLINCSYFDSMSNVVLEAINNGCHVLISEYNGLSGYIPDDLKSDFVILDKWEEKCKSIVERYFDLEVKRKKLVDLLIRKKWEVEIKLLELLS